MTNWTVAPHSPAVIEQLPAMGLVRPPRAPQVVARLLITLVTLVFLALVLGFHALGNPSMINVILKVAAFTYGPLLGLFAFAIFARRRPVDRLVPVVAILAPLICLYVDRNQAALFGTWEVGLEILVLNGAITFAGLWLCSRPAARARYVKGFGTTDEHG